MKVFLKSILGYGIVALAAITEGAAINVLWDWFMIPLGLTTISLSHAIGLAIVISLVTHQHRFGSAVLVANLTDSQKAQEGKALLRYLFARPCFALLVGYIAHWQMTT